MPEVFDSMGKAGGVMVAPVVPSRFILPAMTMPGDLDLLVIPYEESTLLVSQSLVIEVKIVRASYQKQGKAPNDFGFSQAYGALTHGFPYAAVAHLIVSDTSPTDQWSEVFEATIVNAETGQISELRPVKADMMPADLVARTVGRLTANRPVASIGLLSAYISTSPRGGMWMPSGAAATESTMTSDPTLQAIGNFFDKYYRKFMDIPKFSAGDFI